MDIALITQVGIMCIALVGLVKGSDFFVDAAERIGLSWGISPFVIGVTIVAFGTSLPELASSIASVSAGESKMVMGNVVGSNITNITLVLGLVALVATRVPVDFKNMDLPLLISSAFLMWFVVSDGDIAIWEAGLFLVCLVISLASTVGSNETNDDDDRPTSSWKDFAWLIAGGGLVWVGAEYTVSAIQEICTIQKISSGFVAQTVVALGTSLPEVVVSIAAARKGQASIAVGNVIGSNVFNTYAVLGIARMFGPLEIEPASLAFTVPIMIVVTLLLAFMTLTSKISRWEG
ncbi:MAG: calcium/sodium antiporter, partial [Saprospiraceae bacterium]